MLMQVVLADKAAVISGSFWGTSTPYHAAIRKAWQDATREMAKVLRWAAGGFKRRRKTRMLPTEMVATA
jgi:ribosomal protein S5